MSTENQSSSGGDPSDPLSYLTTPNTPTIVKIVNTARADLNDQLGTVQSYSIERGRYQVLLTRPPNVGPGSAAASRAAAGGVGGAAATLSLKPENLIPATRVEKARDTLQQYKSHAMTLLNSPEVKEAYRRGYTSIQNKLPPNIKPEHLGIALVVLFIFSVYYFGITKTIMATSMCSMIIMIAIKDIVDGSSLEVIVRNYPRRCRETLVESIPFLDGKVTDQMALGIVGVMIGLAVVVLMRSPGKVVKKAATMMDSTTMSAKGPGATGMGTMTAESIYKLGFDDATAGREFGSSLPDDAALATATSAAAASAAAASRNLDTLDDYDPTIDYTSQTPKSKNKFGMGSMMSIMYVLNFGRTLALRPDGQGYDIHLLVPNFRNMIQQGDVLKLGMLGFSLYRIVSIFL